MPAAQEPWALIVNPVPELQELLAGAVESLLRGVRPVMASHLAHAQAQLKEWGIDRCRLIVCSPTAPLDAQQTPALDARDLHGMAFIRALRQEHGDEPPVIFPAAFTDGERAAALAGLKNARCIGMKELYRQLKREIDVFVLGKNDPRKYHLDVDILLHAEQPCRWTMRGPDGATPEETGAIDVQARDIAELTTMSRLAAHGDADYLRLLGEHVYSAIMNPAKSDGLKQKLDDGVELVGGMEHARIRFSVDAQTQRILLETLVMPDKVTSELEFCMKKAPIFRKLGGRGGRQPLFQDPLRREEPVDCLLVQGCVTRFDLGKPFQKQLPAASQAKEEIDWLADELDVHREEYGIGEVRVLRYGEQQGSFTQAIQDALADRDYELVHYAGHSGLDTAGQARLFLGPEPGEQPEAGDFSRWAREVQFVFLSSCQSASSQFIVKLVDKDVPAVIGYAWPVLDGPAMEFARAFYRELLAGGRDRRRLEYSFMAAKQALHTAWPDASHWAAPLLFMQVMDARGDGA